VIKFYLFLFLTIFPSQSIESSTQMSQNLIIRNAKVITSEQRFKGDIRISQGQIVEIDINIPKGDKTYQEIDAGGFLVLPGGIDPHVHLTLPGSVPDGESWIDDFTSGSQAALAGGITTVGNISFPEYGETPLETMNRESQIVAKEAIVDVLLHPVITQPTKTVLEQIPLLARQGNPSIKIFMVTKSFVNQYSDYLEIIKAAGKQGMISMIHCEDDSTISSATSKLVSEGKSSLKYYAESRPVESEVLATKRAIEMCEITGAPIYIVHLSSRQALEVCEQVYCNNLPIYVETRPLYLHFTKEKYLEADGPLFVGQPPLRNSEDVAYLWQGLDTGSIHTIGTDHAPWTREQKLHPSHDITNLRPGVNNLQVMLPLLYSEGVVKGKISIEQFVALTSTNSAKIFGLYPQKGTIVVGSDADLVLWDPTVTRVIRGEDMNSRAGFSVYEGMEVTGWPFITIRRGEVVYQNGKIIAQPGSGQLIKRSRTQKP
jgi:dihydropyrimidinase